MTSKKFLTPFLLILLSIAFLSGSFLIFELIKTQKELSRLSLAQISNTPLKKQTKPIVLMFVGDIMLDRGVKYMAERYGSGDYKFPFSGITETLKEADILFGNLEGPISDKGMKVGSIYSFRAEPEAVEGLTFAGFDIVSVTNNHIFDYGRIAMEDTFRRLKEAGINYVGGGLSEDEAHSRVIQEINGAKIAFLAFTNLGSENWVAQKNSSGIAWLKEENIKIDIRKARHEADLVIVSFHFGDEYKTQSNLEQKYFAHLAIDSGADLVVGHHPHVIQEIEKYQGDYIAYSLGNFVFDQGFSEETMRGLLLKVLIENSKIKEIIPIEVRINGFFQPEVVSLMNEIP